MRRLFSVLVLLAFSATSSIAAPPTATPGQTRERAPRIDQAAVAAKGTFATISSSASDVKAAVPAKDLATANKMVGKNGAFDGTISNVYNGGNIIILDFDKNYRSAMVAIVKSENYSHFPVLNTLNGQHVLVTGKVIDYHGRAEIELTQASQVKVVK